MLKMLALSLFASLALADGLPQGQSDPDLYDWTVPADYDWNAPQLCHLDLCTIRSEDPPPQLFVANDPVPVPIGPSAVSSPEPGTAIMAWLALAGLCLATRWIKAK